MDVAWLVVRLALAAVFAVAAYGKLTDQPGTQRAVLAFGVPEAVVDQVAIVLPIAEIVAVLLLLLGLTAWWGALLALLLLVAFSAGVGYNLWRGETPDCHCFGQLHSEPIGWRTLARNALLAAGAMFLLALGRSDRTPSAFHALGHLPPVFWLSLVASVVIVGLLVAQYRLIQRLLTQNEQLLTRVKMVEADLRVEGTQSTALPALVAQTSVAGLPGGSDAPDFVATDLDGGTVTLDSLLSPDRPLLLVFTTTHCPACAAMMPDLGRWQQDLSADVDIVVVAGGPERANRAKAKRYGLARMILEDQRMLRDAYQVQGTPSAVVVRPDGTIGSPVAEGGGPIRWLLDRVLRMVDAQPIALKPALARVRGDEDAEPLPSEFGGPAPSLDLVDLDGHERDLMDVVGSQESVVLFYNTGCSWCNAMLPKIYEWEGSPPPDAPQLIVVATGDEEQIRQLEFKAPTFIDLEFATADLFNINGTPFAALIGEDGTYRLRLAGEDEILAVLRRETDWLTLVQERAG